MMEIFLNSSPEVCRSAFFLPKEEKRNPFAEFETLGYTGWLRGYSMARKIWPHWGFVFATLTIAGEELAFRGVALPMLIYSFGIIPAIFFTVIAFMGIQAITMPSWEPALIPVSSSMIIGLIQACLCIVASPHCQPLHFLLPCNCLLLHLVLQHPNIQ